MSDTPYLQRRPSRGRGPQESEDYNDWQEEVYKDNVYVYNKAGQLQVDLNSATGVMFKELLAISATIDTFEDRLTALEKSDKALAFYSHEQIDNDRFNGTAYEVSPVTRCSFHKNYNQLTLPYYAESSVSKVRYISDDGTFNVSNGLECLVAPIIASTDTTTATIDTSSPYDAIQNKPGRVWERNVLSSVTAANGAQCYLYIRIPNELSATGLSNSIMFHPYPITDVDILEVAYSTDPNVALTPTSTWTPLNENDWYMNNPDAVGNVPPGAWAGDEMINSGPQLFYFKPMNMSAIRLKIQQNSYMERGNKYVYSYGLSNLDIRYDKFAATGKCMVRLDAPPATTINKVTSVDPQIWNVAQANLKSAFSYRVIWETAFNSGIYTTSPVSASQRVWLEITLNQVSGGYTPALSSLIVNYT